MFLTLPMTSLVHSHRHGLPGQGGSSGSDQQLLHTMFRAGDIMTIIIVVLSDSARCALYEGILWFLRMFCTSRPKPERRRWRYSTVSYLAAVSREVGKRRGTRPIRKAGMMTLFAAGWSATLACAHQTLRHLPLNRVLRFCFSLDENSPSVSSSRTVVHHPNLCSLVCLLLLSASERIIMLGVGLTMSLCFENLSEIFTTHGAPFGRTRAVAAQPSSDRIPAMDALQKVLTVN